MAKTILSRRTYDVRFLTLPDSLPQGAWDAYIEEQLHIIYPGNNGAYDYVYRLLGNHRIIIIIMEKRIIEKLKMPHPVVPALMVPAVMKKRRHLENLHLYANGEVEVISFEGGWPLRSRQLSGIPATTKGHWVFLTPPGDIPARSPQEVVIPTPRFTDQCQFKKITSSRKGSSRGWLVKVALVILLAGFSLFRYSQILEDELGKQRLRQQNLQRINHKKNLLIEEINGLQKELEGAESKTTMEPYRVLSALYGAVGREVEIRRLTLQGANFSLNCSSTDPLSISGALSRDGRFSEVSIMRIQEEGKKFLFSLEGRYDG